MPVGIDWSLVLACLLVCAKLGGGVLSQWHPEWTVFTQGIVALAAGLLLFGAVLVHELAHAWMAQRWGVPVRGVTLFVFGGVTELQVDPPSPKADATIAITGPLVSALLGLAALAAGSALADGAVALSLDAADPQAFERAAAQLSPTATLLLWVGAAQLLLAIINLMPGFPLDGGRALRSLLWWWLGDLLAASRVSSLAGRGFGWLLIVLGGVSMFDGMFGQGLWLALLGWVIQCAARRAHDRLGARHALRDVPVSDVMWTQPERIGPELKLDRFVREHLMRSFQDAFVVESNGRLLGLVTTEDVRGVPPPRWSKLRVGDVMTPRDRLAALTPDAAAERALEELALHDVRQIPVLEGGRLCGLVRRRDLSRWLSFHGPGTQA